MKKVAILSLHLGFGGIEKAVTSLANMLVDDYDVEILCDYKLDSQPAFFIDERVKVTYLIEKLKPNAREFKAAVKSFNIVNIIREGITSVKVLYLREARMIKAIKESDADIIISSRLLFNKLLGKYGKPGVRKIGWEHNHWLTNEKHHDQVVKSAQNLDAFVSVSKAINDHYSQYLKCECVSIGNIIDYVPAKPNDLDDHRLISVGSLIPIKGYMDLIDIMNEVCKKDEDWHLDMFGDGIQKQDILDKIEKYGLKDRITVHGYQKKDVINEYLSRSSIYCMTSLTEALPICLLEAAGFGIPAVAFDCPGADEIIEEGRNGYFIHDRNIEAYADKLLEIMNDDALRKRLGAYCWDISKRYYPEEIKKAWVKLIEE